jgi:four helix bundle protein
MMIKTFEDLKVWRDARLFVKMIYSFTNNERMKNDFGYKDQLRRASVSILNNIAEGFERNNNKEYIRFLMYSKASVGEVRSMLYIALDIGYITQDQFNTAYEASLDIIKQLSNFIKYLKSNIKKIENPDY